MPNPRDLSADPPPDAAWWKLDEPLRETLKRSFVDRVTGQPDAGSNVDNAWYAGGEPADVWDATQRVGAMGVNILSRIYERIEKLDPSLRTWRHIRYVRNLWWGGSAGLKVIYDDPDATRACLDGLFPRIARDRLIGALEHQRGSALGHLLEALRDELTGAGSAPPDCDTFREIDRLGEEGLHFCVASHGARPTALDDVHLDWCSPAKRADLVTRRCVYAVGAGVEHWLQARMGLGKPVFTFDAIDAEIARVRPTRGGDEAWERWVERWLLVKWDLAAAGKAGYDASLRWWTECRELARPTPARRHS